MKECHFAGGERCVVMGRLIALIPIVNHLRLVQCEKAGPHEGKNDAERVQAATPPRDARSG